MALRIFLPAKFVLEVFFLGSAPRLNPPAAPPPNDGVAVPAPNPPKAPTAGCCDCGGARLGAPPNIPAKAEDGAPDPPNGIGCCGCGWLL